MQKKKEEEKNRTCANLGCGRPASPDGDYCDACDLEWTLYRRDLRATEASEQEGPGARL